MRDLSKPVGALEPQRLQALLKRMKEIQVNHAWLCRACFVLIHGNIVVGHPFISIVFDLRNQAARCRRTVTLCDADGEGRLRDAKGESMQAVQSPSWAI